MSDKKLKPCFCGRTPEIVTRDVEPQEDRFFSGKAIMFVLCECGQCLFDGAFHEGFSDEEDAANAWNYRVAPSPVMPESLDAELRLAAEIRRVDGNHSLGAAALAEALMPFLRSLTSPAPAEGLPEGCPETLAFGHPHGGPMGQMVYPPSLHLATGGCNRMGCTPVEIHPVGTRAHLSSLTGQAKKGE